VNVLLGLKFVTIIHTVTFNVTCFFTKVNDLLAVKFVTRCLHNHQT